VSSDNPLRKAGSQLDVHVCGDAAGERLDPPAAVGASPARQHDVAVGGDLNLIGHTDQID